MHTLRLDVADVRPRDIGFQRQSLLRQMPFLPIIGKVLPQLLIVPRIVLHAYLPLFSNAI